MSQKFIKYFLCLPLCFFFMMYAYAADNINTPPPPLPIKHVACDSTGTNCTGVGHTYGDAFTECDMGMCYIPVAYYTKDKGNHWHLSFIYRRRSGIDTYHYLYDIACDQTAKHCTAVGTGTGDYRYSRVPLTYVTHNGGERWYVSLVQPPVNHNEDDFRYYLDALKSVACDISNKECVTVGYYGYQIKYRRPLVYISHDGGNTWSKARQLPAPPARFSVLKDVGCNFDSKVCHAKGYYRDNNDSSTEKHPMAFVSQDLGNTWERE